MQNKVRQDFTITGYFYNEDEFSFRKFLNIKSKEKNTETPDLMVIMMNPGSSRPELGFTYEFNQEVPTIPDNTQDQIMRVMKLCNLYYARILNLSDVREPKSNIFVQKIEDLDKKNIYHSVFQKEREKDFKELFVSGVPVICAWGVSPKLSFLGELAFNKIKKEKIIGIPKTEEAYAYYHPLPQNYNKQKEWVETISMSINSLNTK